MIRFDQSIYDRTLPFQWHGDRLIPSFPFDFVLEEFVTHLICSELRPQFQKNSILALPTAAPESCPRDFGSQNLRDLGMELAAPGKARRLTTVRDSVLRETRAASNCSLAGPTTDCAESTDTSASGRSWKLRGGVIKIWKIHRFPTNPLCQRDGGQCYGIGNQIRSRNNLYSEGGWGLGHKKRDKF